MAPSKSSRKRRAPAAEPAALHHDDGRDTAAWRFPVVGVGASAGGLDAFTQLLHALPVDTGLAFVLIPHLSPSHGSHMVDILSRATTMPVREVKDEPAIEPNHIYVIPPDRSMVMGDGTLKLLPRKDRGVHHPIDQFLQSLAQAVQHKAIGVILSGTANDGTIGLEEIKAAGGITFAQDESAQYDGMPRSAILAGCVDFILSPAEIAAELTAIAQHAYIAPMPGRQTATYLEEQQFVKVLHAVHQATGVDFTNYKSSTLYRRISRRMALHKIDDMEAYVQLLLDQPAEIELLYQDVLINVTAFFRDAESFEYLKSRVLPQLLIGRARMDPIRIWVVGCSTGEEAYSIAIAASEVMEEAGQPYPLQVFATDLNGASIDRARAGVYPRAIADQVSPERLRRYFQETDGGYRIVKSIRDMCIFARHNSLVDAPFSRIDLISCRNLLIYFEPVMQQRLMPVLHYALNPRGFLWLGSSESTGTYRELFDTLDAKHKVFVKKPGTLGALPHVQVRREQGRQQSIAHHAVTAREETDAQRESERILLLRYTPPGVLVDRDLNVLNYRGETGRFLAPSAGKASLSLLKMLREGLLVGVRAALTRAKKARGSVRTEGLRVKTNGGQHRVDIEIITVRGRLPQDDTFLVLFEEPASPLRRLPKREPEGTQRENATNVRRLEQELGATKEYLQAVIEQQEAANEELQSANEEVQSTNEELQSINEELETSKEEIQSTNEELATVNEELQTRNAELAQSNNDFSNLLASVQLPIVMLGQDLRIRRFTPLAEQLLNLIPTDVGRSITDIKLGVDLPDIEQLVIQAIDQMAPQQREVRDREGRWYSVRIRPYRTSDNRIDGAVIVFVDVDSLKRTEESLRASEERLRITSDQAPIGIFETDLDGRFLRVNDRFCRMVGRSAEQLLRTRSFDITAPEDVAADSEGFQRLRRGEIPSLRVEKRYLHSAGHPLWVEVHRFNVTDTSGQVRFTVGFVQDIDERKAREARFRGVMDRAPALIWMSGPDGMQYVNQAFLDFVGEQAADVLGDRWERYIHRDDLPAYRATYAAAVANVQPLEHQFRLRRADGEYRWLMAVALPQFGAAGQFTGFTGSAFDITDFKRAEESLRNEDVRKNEFIAMLAHELRNPLAPMANIAHVLRTPGIPPETLAWAHDVLERQLQALTRMVSDLLDVSRISLQKIRLQREPVDIADLVSRSLDAAREQFAARDQRVLAEVSTEPLRVFADPVRLEQVLGNVFNNASKFTPPGGHVWLTVAPDPLDHHVTIRVRDDGSGIDADSLPRVFEMFRQADSTIERAQGGLGIGLSLVRRLIELHDGTVDARSEGPGKGSEFTIRLPLMQGRFRIEAEPEPEAPSADGGAQRILIVDDNADAATSLALLLRHQGHTVAVAHSGAAGLEQARTFQPRFVLLDLGMPGMSGFEVARRLRDTRDGPPPLIVAVSGYSSEDFYQRARDAGFDHFLTKPLDLRALREVLAGRGRGFLEHPAAR